MFPPPTEGSAIFQGASRSRRRRLHFSEIKISLCLLHFEGRGSLDLAEIYPFSLWTRCAFDFRHPTLAYPPPNHTAGAPALRTCNLGERPPCAHVTWASWISSLFSLGASLARVCFKPPALRYPTQFLKTLYRIATDVGLCSVHLRFLAPDVHRPPPVEGFPTRTIFSSG